MHDLESCVNPISIHIYGQQRCIHRHRYNTLLLKNKEAFNFYGEVQFQYEDMDCELIRSNNEGGISFYCEKIKPIIFKNKIDFIQNAKIKDKFVRDIWNKVENPRYM